MAATLTVDTAGFRRALHGLARFTGADLSTVIRAEAGSILKACAGQTKVATIASARDRAVARSLNSITHRGRATPSYGYMTINSGQRGGEPGLMWYRTKQGRFQLAGDMRLPSGSYRWSNLHFPNLDWPGMVEGAEKAARHLRDRVPAARQAIGLARQSWVQIADAIGIALESVPGGRLSAAGLAKARAAIASNRRSYVNGTGTEHTRAQTYFVELVNRLPYGTGIGLDRVLIRNVNARVRFFEQNLRRGVFDKLSTLARAYPGITVRRT